MALGGVRVPEYIYRSRDISGRDYSGTLEADSLEAFYKLLRERGQFCLDVREAGRASMDINLSGNKINLKYLVVFCRQFSTMLSAGIPVVKCLDILYAQTANKRFKAVILAVYEQVQRGESLSRALKAQNGAFPRLMISMVECGESSGTIDTVMSRLADQFEKDYRSRSKVQQAMIYPAFLAAVTVAVVVFLVTFIMPRFIGILTQFGGKLPGLTQGLLNFGSALTGYWYVFIAVIVAVVLAWHTIMKIEPVKLGWDRFKLRVPGIGKTLTVTEASRFSRTLASLFSSGMPVIQSIDIVARIMSNKYIASRLDDVGEDIKRGVALSAAVKKVGIFPQMLDAMLSIGEETGRMDEILNKTAAFYEDEADNAVTKLISILEPVMIVILAIVVAVIILATIMPIFAIYSQISAAGTM
jgi:type IV pilus assembly protein PilC